MREEDKRKKERGKKEKARAAEKRWKRGTGRRRVFPRQRALIPLDVSQRVANIDLRGTSTLFNPRRRCFICLLVALSSAFLHHHHPQRHTLAEFLSVSPSLFSLSFLSLVHFIVRLRTSAADELDPESFAELSYYVNRGKMSVSVEDLG